MNRVRRRFDSVWTRCRRVAQTVWNPWMLLSDQSRASSVSAIVLATSFFFLILPALQDPLGVLFWYYLLMPVAAGACMGMFPFLSKRFGQVMDDHGNSVLWVGSVATGAVFVGASVFVSFADEAWVDCLVAQDHTGTGTLIVFLLLTMGVATWATLTGLVHRTLPPTWTATRSFIAGLAFVSAALAPVFFALLVFQAAEVATAQIQCSPEIIEGLSQLKKGSVVL